MSSASIIPTTNGFSNLLLASINAAFNSNLSYSSVTFQTPKGPLVIPLVTFLGNPNFTGYTGFGISFDEIYNGLIAAMNTFIADVVANNVPNYNFGTIGPSFRMFVVIADGTVFFDSAKKNNTYENFLTNSINNNQGVTHNIQEAYHSKDGIGYETRWSSTTRGLETLYSVRLGQSETGIIGVTTYAYGNQY